MFGAMEHLPRCRLLLIFALFVLNCQCQLVPEGFSCTRDMPRRWGIYSRPPNVNLVKVDLIHVFCGQIERYGASGFHARPGNVDPQSVTTVGSRLKRRPRNQYDYAIYSEPKIYDSYISQYVRKSGISSIWPTAMSLEDITWVITYLVDACRYM